MSCLYILEVKLSLVSWFANIYFSSQPAGCLFYFIYGFLCCTKTYKFDYFPFVHFCFYFYYLGRLKKTCHDLRQLTFYLCSLLRVLWCHVLHLLFKSWHSILSTDFVVKYFHSYILYRNLNPNCSLISWLTIQT